MEFGLFLVLVFFSRRNIQPQLIVHLYYYYYYYTTINDNDDE